MNAVQFKSTLVGVAKTPPSVWRHIRIGHGTVGISNRSARGTQGIIAVFNPEQSRMP